MKLVLANNQTERFTSFYQDLNKQSDGVLDYAPYDSLLFVFDAMTQQKIQVHCLKTGKGITDYDGLYLNGYLDTYELAATMAICCQALSLPFVNRELAEAPSLTKLSGYAKLMAAGVTIPRTIAGAKAALTAANLETMSLSFPMVLKRADADRGIDNFKVQSTNEISELLEGHEAKSLWILQDYIENNGYYLVTFYNQQPVFGIFRSLGERLDGNEQKAHMFKPKGGINAKLIELKELPDPVVSMAQRAMNAMNRQIGSVDLLYDASSGSTHVLEVNYNPQLVTIETFKEVRVKAFLEGLKQIK